VSQYTVRKKEFLRKVPGEDILMAVNVFTYTTSLVSLYLYSETASNVDYDDVTPEYESFVGRRLGILGIILEGALQTTLWGNKLCLSLFYKRINLFGFEHKIIVIILMFIGLSYMAVIIALYDGWCRPLSDYLVLHPHNKQCLSLTKYNILQLSMNLSTDLVLILVPVLRVSMLKIEIGKKLMLIAFLSMGMFTMLSAILLKVHAFTTLPDKIGAVWLIWAVREVSTAMLVGNLVFCVPVLKMLWSFF
ncbi:hypothetical protein LZ31DRAFT_440765, partial [Colletotrichum somersetense]